MNFATLWFKNPEGNTKVTKAQNGKNGWKERTVGPEQESPGRPSCFALRRAILRWAFSRSCRPFHVRA